MDEVNENHERCMHCGAYTDECMCSGGMQDERTPMQRLNQAVAAYWDNVDCDSATMMAPYEKAVRELAAEAGVTVEDALGGVFQRLAQS